MRPTRLALSRDAFVILALIFGIVLTEWVGDALAYVVEPDDPSRSWALLAGPLSVPLERIGPEAATTGFGVLAWSHIFLVLGFGTYLPYSKHLHILTSEPNVYLRNLEPRGALRKMDLEAEPAPGEELVFGAKGLKDLTWRHLLDGLSCTECGRCMEFCPASMTGKTLSPKHFMEGLRDQIVAAETALAAAAGAQRAWKGGVSGGAAASEDALGLAQARATEALCLPLVDHAIPEEAVWQCTTCGWCVEGLPGADRARRQHRRDPTQPGPGGEPLPEGAERRVPQHGDRRQPVGAAAQRPPRLGEGPRAGRPRTTDRRLALPIRSDDRPWRTIHSTADEDALAGRVLYWVGCAGAFDDRNRKVVRAMAALLKQADVPFAVLGPRETCTGDPARRAGNEYLFQMLAEENVATLTAAHDEHSVRTIVASCPHCFNTIRNEYPQFGLAGVEVIHHTQLLDRLVSEGRLEPERQPGRVVAYHDACYLGRYNEVYEPGRRSRPRQVPGAEVEWRWT